jgi:hypothetical protein
VCCHFVGILLSLITDSKLNSWSSLTKARRGRGNKRGLRIGRPEHQVTGRATVLFGCAQLAEQEDIRRIPVVRKILFGFHLKRVCLILKKSCHIELLPSSIHEKDVKVKVLTATDTYSHTSAYISTRAEFTKFRKQSHPHAIARRGPVFVLLSCAP